MTFRSENPIIMLAWIPLWFIIMPQINIFFNAKYNVSTFWTLPDTHSHTHNNRTCPTNGWLMALRKFLITVRILSKLGCTRCHCGQFGSIYQSILRYSYITSYYFRLQNECRHIFKKQHDFINIYYSYGEMEWPYIHKVNIDCKTNCAFFLTPVLKIFLFALK